MGANFTAWKRSVSPGTSTEKGGCGEAAGRLPDKESDSDYYILCYMYTYTSKDKVEV
jgi:hypothetical protein